MMGGGSGSIEAAYLNDGYSIGCTIILPYRQEPNLYCHKWINIPYLFLHKFL
jgi:hypothetical protein